MITRPEHDVAPRALVLNAFDFRVPDNGFKLPSVTILPEDGDIQGALPQ